MFCVHDDHNTSRVGDAVVIYFVWSIAQLVKVSFLLLWDLMSQGVYNMVKEPKVSFPKFLNKTDDIQI